MSVMGVFWVSVLLGLYNLIKGGRAEWHLLKVIFSGFQSIFKICNDSFDI
jgi:hypothetical protein